MRDLFAIIAIILTVIGLGVFRVPDENALVAAGIKAAADGAVYQEKHPVQISVKGRAVTAKGRVETKEAAQAIEARLAALDGVEAVIGDWVVLPNAAPFSIALSKSDAGITAQGFVPGETTLAALSKILELEQTDLVVAAGVPDADWAKVVQRTAQALLQMVDGTVDVVDRRIAVSGTVPLPMHAAAIEADLAQLPDGYELTLDVKTQDDGLPYSFFVSRDPIMGVRYSGKLPPDYTPSGLNALGGHVVGSVRTATVDLGVPTFQPVTDIALKMFEHLEDGVITVSPDVLTIQGGPMPQETIEQIETLGGELPGGVVFTTALTPHSDGIPLSLLAEWDGRTLALSGHVPSTFLTAQGDDATAVFLEKAGFGDAGQLDLTYAPHPDLHGWDAPFWAALPALKVLEAGRLTYGAEGVAVTGTAADPQARRAADVVLDNTADFDVLLLVDGNPPEFRLSFDVATNAAVVGKLPAGLSPAALSKALGGFEIRGKPQVSPDGEGAEVLRVLVALRGWLSEVESISLDYTLDTITVSVVPMPGQDAAALKAALVQALPPKTVLHVKAEPPPLEGARRMHVVLQQPQIFAEGYWMPSLSFAPSVENCDAQMGLVPPIPFETGRFGLGFGAEWPLAHLAAVLRICTRFGSLTAQISAEVSSSEVPALNRQLSRRRTESVRLAMIERGVSADRMTSRTADQAQGGDRVVVSWK